MASNGDRMRSGIGDRNVTNPVVIEFDQGRTSLLTAKSTGHEVIVKIILSELVNLEKGQTKENIIALLDRLTDAG